MSDPESLPRPILNAAGEIIGVFVPPDRHKPIAPPTLSRAEEEEIQRRLVTPEDSVSAEEFIELVEIEAARLERLNPMVR